MMPSDPPPLPEVRFLKLLVTALAVTMIAGLITIVALLVIRLPAQGRAPALPAAITLPEGVTALSVSFAEGRVVVLGQGGEVLLYSPEGALLGQTRLSAP
ncbi:hypothetical protein LPB142_13240 [Rhodobacter xanthinilyticus]|uniref:Uncharacterized protein n=2 Tax=Rhodobacter xanthinilyticus TaxID=1850250 RepID=A0A1D9MGR7_9RHOB|nr:hypothetical protein LPB142_13240 [Rhodobacter xanthinilyticus]